MQFIYLNYVYDAHRHDRQCTAIAQRLVLYLCRMIRRAALYGCLMASDGWEHPCMTAALTERRRWTADDAF